MTDQYFYYADQDSAPLEVSITTTETEIAITRLTGEALYSWPIADVVSVDEDRVQSILWLANDRFPYARLVVCSKESCDDIWKLLEAKPKPRVPNWSTRFAIAIPSVAVLLVLFGLFGPSMNAVILQVVPESFDKRLGDWAIDAVSHDWEFCDNPEAHVALEKIVARLEAASPTNFDFKVRVVKDHDVNALAAPGGNIVILSGLLQGAESAEEVAGILAHEMAHVTERHGSAMLVKQIFLSFLFALGGSDRHGVGHELVAMHMNRAQEREADKNGALLLAKAKISVGGLRTFFERLAAKDASSRVLSFLHSHPDSVERAGLLKDPANLKTLPLLNKKEWALLKNYCKDAPGAS